MNNCELLELQLSAAGTGHPVECTAMPIIYTQGIASDKRCEDVLWLLNAMKIYGCWITDILQDMVLAATNTRVLKSQC